MDNSGEQLFQPRAGKDRFLLIANLILIICTGIALWTAFSYYRGLAATISLSESRYLSTEWRLLQEMRIQTDQKLLEKDREIAALTRRYMQAVQGNASTEELHLIETKLQQASDEREEIVLQSRKAAAEADPEQQEWLKELLPKEIQTTIIKLLQERIEMLETQLEEHTLYGRELEKELVVLKARQQETALKQEAAIAEKLTQINALTEAGIRLRTALHAALEDMELKGREAGGRDYPLLADLETRALIRALADSQTIRTAYPSLLESLDRYFETYGAHERLRGRREAYAAAAKSLEKFAGETGRP